MVPIHSEGAPRLVMIVAINLRDIACNEESYTSTRVLAVIFRPIENANVHVIFKMEIPLSESGDSSMMRQQQREIDTITWLS